MSAIELFDARKPSRYSRLRLALKRRGSSGKHRVHDKVALLQRQLRESQQLNENLTRLLDESMVETKTAESRLAMAEEEITELRRALNTAIDANEANRHTTDFRFAERPAEPMEQVTHPVPVVRLLDEPILMPVINPDPAIAAMERAVHDASEAATTMIERITQVAKRDDSAVADTMIMSRVVDQTMPMPSLKPVAASHTGTFRVTKVGASPFASTNPASPTKISHN